MNRCRWDQTNFTIFSLIIITSTTLRMFINLVKPLAEELRKHTLKATVVSNSQLREPLRSSQRCKLRTLSSPPRVIPFRPIGSFGTSNASLPHRTLSRTLLPKEVRLLSRSRKSSSTTVRDWRTWGRSRPWSSSFSTLCTWRSPRRCPERSTSSSSEKTRFPCGR